MKSDQRGEFGIPERGPEEVGVGVRGLKGVKRVWCPVDPLRNDW